jgi:hypothetical protein
MDFIFISAATATALFLGMLFLLEAGRRLGMKRIARDPEAALEGTGTLEGAIFALFGLLVAFTFSGAAGRFDTRRQLIVEEANDIGTAYLRIDLLPAETQPQLRKSFQNYLDARLAVHRKSADPEAAQEALEDGTRLQSEIWSQTVAACAAKKDPATTTLVLSALNSMIDITTTRNMATKMHPPAVIFVLLFSLGLGCALLAGYGMAASKWHNWSHTIGFAAVTALTFYVILDIEFPRLGFIRVDATDQVLVELRKSMK